MSNLTTTQNALQRIINGGPVSNSPGAKNMTVACPHCGKILTIDSQLMARILGAIGGTKAAAKGPEFTKERARLGGLHRWDNHKKKPKRLKRKHRLLSTYWHGKRTPSRGLF